MTYTRTARTLAATGVTVAFLCALPAVGHTVTTGSCDRLRDGQAFIDWARAQRAPDVETQSARPARRVQSLRSLFKIAATDAE
jgi:hypothetical protein